jgi:hypothetical protein
MDGIQDLGLFSNFEYGVLQVPDMQARLFVFLFCLLMSNGLRSVDVTR